MRQAKESVYEMESGPQLRQERDVYRIVTIFKTKLR